MSTAQRGGTVEERLETGFYLRTRGTSIGKCCMRPWLKEADWSEHKLLCHQPPQLRKQAVTPAASGEGTA